MGFSRSMSKPGRGALLDNGGRIKGYGIAIDYLDGWAHDARLFDRSPALSVEKVRRGGFDSSSHRRFGFVEFHGEGTLPKTGLLRYVGDVFCVDRRVAEFIWQAAIEKIERDAARGGAA